MAYKIINDLSLSWEKKEGWGEGRAMRRRTRRQLWEMQQTLQYSRGEKHRGTRSQNRRKLRGN